MSKGGVLKFKRLTPKAFIPNYPREGSSGMRLYSMNSEYIMDGGTTQISLGFAVQIPSNHFGLITNSSYLAKQGILAYRESIDEDFLDEVKLKLHNYSPVPKGIAVGSVVGYLTIIPYARKKIEIVEEF